MSGLRPLVTRADDFGVTPGTNDAILDCIAAGWIKNVGVMAPGPALDHRLDELIALQDQVAIGVHGTLTSEWDALRWGPVSEGKLDSIKRPEDSSFFKDTVSLYKQGQIDEMVAELRAQIHLLQSKGLRPVYFDSHMNFTWIEGLGEALRQLCAEAGLLYTHAGAHGHFRLPMKQSALPEASEWLESNKTFETDHPGKTAVWVFHPAYPDDPSGFPVSVSEERHYEALHLTRDAEAVAAAAEKAGWQPLRYL